VRVIEIFSHFASTYFDYGFEYGNLEEKFPDETYEQIKTRRQSNWDLLKTLCNSYKVTGTTLQLPNNRIEFYRPINDEIIIANTNTLKIYGHETDMVFYPFTLRAEINNYSPFKIGYGSNSDIRNLTIKCAQKQGKHETYDVILKKGGNLRLIEVTGSIRPGFWTDLQIGNTIYYTKDSATVAESRVVASFDSIAKTITVTVDIGAGYTSDNTGFMCRFFNEDISEEDYNTYGEFWITATGSIRGGAGFLHSNTVNTVNTTFSFNNVLFQNWQTGFDVSSNAFDVIYDNLRFDNNGVAFNAFRGVMNNGQSISGVPKSLDLDNLTFSNNGYYGVGQISADSSLIYGAGGYWHPVVIINLLGTTRCIDNIANGLRQFSGSLEEELPYEGYIENFIASGGVEYDLYTSNCMPVTVDNLEVDELRIGGNVIINGGEIRESISSSSLLQPPTGVPISWEFNNIGLSGLMTTTFSADRELIHDIYFNNCNFYISLLSSIQTMLAGTAKRLEINNGVIFKKDAVGTWNPTTGTTTGSRGSNFISNNFSEVDIDGLSFNEYPFMFSIDNSSPQRPYLESFYTRTLNDIDFKCYAIWLEAVSNTAGSISDIWSGTNIIIRNNFTGNAAGKYYTQSLQGKSGTIAKTIVASKTYAQIGAVTNILELDWEHDYYETSGTINAIVVANSWASSYSSNPIYSRPIRIYAVGGDVTFSTFDSVARPTSNIIGANGTTILAGNYLDLTIDNHRVLQTGTTVTSPTVATGNDVTTDFHNVLLDWILDPTVLITVTAGAVTATADANGVFNHADVVGIVDPWTGKWQFIFTNPVPNATPIIVTYNKPNVWKNTGAWILP